MFRERLWKPIWPAWINRYIECDCGRPVCKQSLDKMSDIWWPSGFLEILVEWEEEHDCWYCVDDAEHDRFRNMDDDGSEEQNHRRDHGEVRSTAAE